MNMSYILSAMVALILPLSAAESRSDETWEFFGTTKAGDEEISVRIVTGPWDPSDHKIEAKTEKGWMEITNRSDDNRQYRINGRKRIWGADGFHWPTREVKLFVVKWGDEIITVPRKHWKDYFGLLLYTQADTEANEEIGGCWTNINYNQESKSLEVISNGGGGAGWYVVKWEITKNGTIRDAVQEDEIID